MKMDVPPKSNKEENIQKNEEVFNLLNGYEDGLDKDEAWDFWRSLRKDNKEKSFFENLSKNKTEETFNNFSNLKKIWIIAFAMRHLSNTPLEIFEIIKDNEIIKSFLEKFFKENKKHPSTVFDMNLLVMEAYIKYKNSPDYFNNSENHNEDEGWWFRADRLNKGKGLIVSNYEEDDVWKLKEDYPEACKNFLAKFDLACAIEGYQDRDSIMTTEGIFDEEFEKLNDEQKSDFLIRGLASCHSALLFEEVWNSDFSSESVKRDNHRQRESSHHNVAHSMIYNTYQPNSIYESNKGRFDYEMTHTSDIGGGIEEYPFHKLLISVLEKMETLKTGNEKLVDIITEFWSKNKNPIFGSYVASALSHLDPNRAASNLMNLIQKEKGEKNYLSSILYRIEFGKIGISKEGVRYLEKMYDLGEYNNPDFYVERLTPVGEMGIFNEEKELIKYFELGDITTSEERIKADVLDFVYNTLFYPKEKETHEEKEERLKYLKEFQEKYYKIANNEIFTKTNIRLNNLNFKEQGVFVKYFSTLENHSVIVPFLNKYRENGIKAFLSIYEGGNEISSKILKLGEGLQEDMGKIVFAKYGEIINVVDNCEEEIKKIFGDKDISTRVLSSVKETLLKRGAKMLSDLGDKVSDSKFEVNEQEILKELDDIKEETIVLGESYVGLYKEGVKIPIENITKIEKILAKDLSEKEKEELVRVYKNGRPKTTYENEDHLKLLTEEFKQELENQNTKILNIRFNGDVIIFAVVDQKEKDTIYIGGLTFVDEVRNSAIAVSAMEAVLEEFKDYNIRALVDSKNSILRMYQNRFGFNIVKELPREENAGELYFEIERPKDKKIEQHQELKEVA